MQTGKSSGNGLIRVARIGKLYKLVKITRLIRLLKIVKSKGKLKKMGDLFKVSAGAERVFSFIAVFIMVCHMMACIWIFSADISVDTQIKKNSDGTVKEVVEGESWMLDYK